MGTAERQKSTLKTAGVKANYCGWNAECRVRRRFRVPDAFRPVRTMAALPPLFRVLLGAILLMPNGTPSPLGNRMDDEPGSSRGSTLVMQILKAARIAASDIVGVSAAASGRLSTSRLLRSEAIPAVSSNGDIIHLSP